MSAKIKTPGAQLKAAREELGKSQSDMAKLTRISVQQLQGLEADRYESIPAPMYVRGFMKLYAQKLGIPPEPLVEMYERMRNGELPEETPTAPRPVSDSLSPEPEMPPEHPEFSREVRPRPPPRKTGRMPAVDLQALLEKLPRFSLPADKAEWLRMPAIGYAAAGLGVLLLLLLGFRSCGGNPEVADTPEAVSETDSPLTVRDPLLRAPEPVFFQLPSSYQ